MGRRHVMADAHAQTILGGACFLLAAFLIWDAYEGRGRRRPFLASALLP